MRLTQEQLDQFDREGYLFFPGLFSARETKLMTDAVPTCTAAARPTTCARKAATPCAPTSPRTWSASPSHGWRATRAWCSR